jgi:hypothetical protein
VGSLSWNWNPHCGGHKKLMHMKDKNEAGGVEKMGWKRADDFAIFFQVLS